MKKQPTHAPYLPVDKLLPGSESQDERALLGSLVVGLSGRDIFALVEGIVSEDDFLDVGYGRVFGALVTIREAGLPTNDPVVLKTQFAALGVPESCRNSAFIHKLLMDLPNAAHVLYYAGQVRAFAQKRRIIKLATDLLEFGYDNQVSPEQVLQTAEAGLSRIAGGITVDVASLGEATEQALGELDSAAADDTFHRGSMVGIPDVDQQAGPLMPGELGILAARPAMGKTALAMQKALHNARQGRRVLFVSLEMRSRELARRLLCQEAEVDSRLLRGRRVDAAARARLQAAHEELAGLPVRLWDPASATLAEIRGVARHMKATGGLYLLIVDYLGLINPSADSKRLQRHEQVQQTSAGLKELAKELCIPVLALCQLNREADGEEPRLSHLRESGAIEQDADMVLLLHHPEREQSKSGNQKKRIAYLIIGKHRHGETGRIKLQWHPSETRFSTFSEGF